MIYIYSIGELWFMRRRCYRLFTS